MKTQKHITLHKLNNLLTNVCLSTELLLQGVYGALTSKQKKQLNVVLSQTKKIKNLLKKAL